jgi:hypothetical protein
MLEDSLYCPLARVGVVHIELNHVDLQTLLIGRLG